MYHLCAFTEAIAAAAETDADALTDQILTIQNNHFLLGKDMRLMAFWSGSTTLTRVRLSQPSLRMIALPYMRPITQAIIPPTDPNLADLSNFPLTLHGGEEFACLATTALAMGTERFTGLAWLMDSYDPAPQGEAYTLRFSSTTALVANTWTDLSLTWADNIPQGLYAAIGSEVQSTNGIAHRWIFDSQYWRPGHLSITGLGNRSAAQNYNGKLGVMGRFGPTTLPRLQGLGNGTDNAHEGYLSCIRIR